MIIWLASYPKSGNTLLRSILASYFFSDDGSFDFKYTYLINQFPRIDYFLKAGVDISNDETVFKNYLKVQELINNENSKIKFFKTHSQYFENKEYNFTNWKNSLCALYVVRDPRNVIKSFSHHNQSDNNETLEVMLDDKRCLPKTTKHCKTFIGSWGSNYNSWKGLGKNVFIIKYEDLILKKRKTLLSIFKFLENFGFNLSNLNMQKLNKSLKTTEFKNMQNLEKKQSFKESVYNPNTGKKIPFFNLGPKNDWKHDLEENIRIKLEDTFKKEMKELGYL